MLRKYVSAFMCLPYEGMHTILHRVSGQERAGRGIDQGPAHRILYLMMYEIYRSEIYRSDEEIADIVKLLWKLPDIRKRQG